MSVKEGGADYGAALTLSAYGTRGAGGPAGRPLTIDELRRIRSTGLRPSARRWRLNIARRAAAAPEAYGLQFISPYITMTTPLEEAKLEIAGAGRASCMKPKTGAMPVKKEPVNGRVKPPEAVTFFVSRNLRDEPLPQLMAALAGRRDDCL